MNIATKAGSVVLKGSSVAASCACCAPPPPPGWYCYTSQCPCYYDSVMPATLQASFAIALSDTIYLPQRIGFLGNLYRSCMVTPVDAQSASRTIVLNRYRPTTNHVCEYRGSGGGLEVKVQVGGVNRVTIAVGFPLSYQELDSGAWQCTATGSVGLSLFSMYGSVDCTASPLQATKAAWANASSLSYDVPASVFFPGVKEEDGDGTYYVNGFWFDLTLGGADVAPCVQAPTQSISGSWAFDLLYTDTSGAERVNRRLHRACTLTVS